MTVVGTTRDNITYREWESGHYDGILPMSRGIVYHATSGYTVSSTFD